MCAITGGIALAPEVVMGVGVLAIGGAIAGGVMSTIEGIQSAEAQKQQAEDQAKLAEQNALLADRRSENIELQANQKRAALLRDAQQKRGSARAGYAANGVMLGSGVTAEYEADIANAYDLDLKNLNYDVASERWQQEVSAVNSRNAAAQYRAQADGFARQKITSLIGGVISTVASTASTTLSAGMALNQLGLLGTGAGSGESGKWAVNYKPNTKTMLA